MTKPKGYTELFKLGKIKVPHRKNTAKDPGMKMQPPKKIILPMVQHIGAPAEPQVKVGDEVLVGTLIGKAASYVSVNIHSPVSGKVVKIDRFLQSNGQSCAAVIIESDGNMTLDPSIKPPVVESFEDLSRAALECGRAGLGGAGFPTHVKLDPKRVSDIDVILLNGAECEPYITSDTRIMLDRSADIKFGLEKIFSLSGIKRAIIGIEGNKPECVKHLSEVFSDDERVEVVSLPSKYPQGGEKVLIHNTTGRIVPEGGLPADVGVIVMNVNTLATLAKYLKDGIPLIEKLVTVDGSAIKEPRNVFAPIGTPLSEVIEAAGGYKCDPGKVMLGGPMMGVTVYSAEETPVMKNTNAITALSESDTVTKPRFECVHCGRCVSACPMGLNPPSFARAMRIENKNERIDALKEAKTNLCIECGCCSFICPSARPLVENNRLAKAELRAYMQEMARKEKEAKK